MAACGSLQHIFDNKPLDPLPSLLHPCKHMNPLDAPHTDVFSSFNLGKKPDSVPSSPDRHHRSISLSSANSESLSEALGFESFDDIEEFPDDEWEQQQPPPQHSFGTTTKHAKPDVLGEMKRSRISGKEIPPPISSIGRRVCFESYRYNGRLILKEVKIPAQELLHAYREDGRLKLQFIQFDDEREVKRENGEKVGNHDDGKM